MAQRGRRSSTSNIVALAPTGTRSRLTPPAFLSTVEVTMFADLAAHNRHLTSTDVALLAGYVQALGKMHKMAKKSEIADWERAARVALALGTKLRLTPQSTTDPQTIGRRR